MSLREIIFVGWLIACLVLAVRRPFFGAVAILVHFVLKETLVVETYGAFYDYPFFEPLYIATFVGVLVNEMHRLNSFLPRTMVDWGMLSFLLVLVISASVNGVNIWGHKYIDLFLKATVMYFLLSRLADTPKRVLIAALALVFSTGYLAYLAWDNHRQGYLIFARPYWFTQWHEFGAQVIIVLPLAGAMLRGRFRMALKIVLFVLVPLFFIVAIRTMSRSAMLGAFAGAGMLMWYYRRKWYVGVAVLPLLVYGLFHQTERTSERLESIWTHKLGEEEDLSIASRIQQFHTAMNIINSHPLLGLGPRQYFVEYKLYVNPEDAEEDVSYTMHSVPLLILTEEGLLGFATYYGLIVLGSILAARYAAKAALDSPELEDVAVVAAGALMGYLAWCAFSLGQPTMWQINIYGTVALVMAARFVTEAHFRERVAERAMEQPNPLWAARQPSTEILFP